jgi:hypothetical protein
LTYKPAGGRKPLSRGGRFYIRRLLGLRIFF